MSAPAPQSAPPAKPAPRMPDKIGKYVVVQRGRPRQHRASYTCRTMRITAAMSPSRSTTWTPAATRNAPASPARCSSPRRTWSGCCSIRNILPIYDAGEENGHCYIVTEHVHGARTLAAYCRPDNLLRIDDTVEIMFKCAKALHYAHSRGVIHRDVKPCNIMLTQDSDVRIIDFGIALVRGFGHLTHRGHRRQPLLHVSRAGAELRAHQPLRSVFARRGDVRAADRLAPVPRRQPAEAAAPDRVRDAAADPHAAQGRARGAGNRRGHRRCSRTRRSAARAAWTSPRSSRACTSACARRTPASIARSSSACCGA